MKLTASKLGASSKQLKFLGVLGLILVGVLIYNFSSSSAPVPVTASAPVGANPVPLKGMPAVPRVGAQDVAERGTGAWRISVPRSN